MWNNRRRCLNKKEPSGSQCRSDDPSLLPALFHDQEMRLAVIATLNCLEAIQINIMKRSGSFDAKGFD